MKLLYFFIRSEFIHYLNSWKGSVLIMWIFSIPVGLLLAFGVLIEWKRKRRNDYSHRGTNSHTRPGESSNYKMGDNNYTSGGE